MVGGFEKHIKATYGVDLQIGLLSTGGGDTAFWQKMEAFRKGGGKANTFPIDLVRLAPDLRTLNAMVEGAFMPLSDHANLIPNLSKVNAPGIATFTLQGRTFGTPMFQPTVSLFFNKEQAPTPPKNLEALAEWVRANPRKFTYEDPRSSSGIGSGTMFVLGVMKKFGNVDVPSTWQKGWEFLKAIQPHIYPQPNAGEQMLELMRRGEISLMPFWNDWGLFAKDTLKIGFMENYLPDDGMPIRNTPIAVPRNAGNPTAALLFVNWAISPEIQASLAKEQRQLPANMDAAVLKEIPVNSFGFPIESIRKNTFPSFNNRQSITAIATIADGWSTNVIGR